MWTAFFNRSYRRESTRYFRCVMPYFNSSDEHRR